jgi:hypothetical protein
MQSQASWLKGVPPLGSRGKITKESDAGKPEVSWRFDDLRVYMHNYRLRDDKLKQNPLKSLYCTVTKPMNLYDCAVMKKTQVSLLAIALFIIVFAFSYKRQLSWEVTPLEDVFEEFYVDYTAFLNESLATKNFSAGVVLHQSADNNGLGNRWPPLITSFLLAMLTKKIFLTTYKDFDKYFDPVSIMDIRWETWSSVVSETEWYDVNCTSNYTRVHSELMTLDWNEKLFIRFTSWDWNVPILFANPHYKHILQKMFPKNAAFYPLAKKLMVPSYSYRILVDKYMQKGPYTVGMHIRLHKTPPNRKPLDHEHFVSIAKGLMTESKSHRRAVFVASDDEQARSDTIKMLGKTNVSVVFQEGEFLNNHTQGGNPGTEDSAVLDLFILAQADDLICTHGSSFGHVAASLAGKNYYLVHNERNEGFKETDVLVTRMLTPEPCWYASKTIYEEDSEIRSAIRKLPGWEQYLQCHY